MLCQDVGPRQRTTMSTGEDMDGLLKSYHKMQENISDNMLSLARNMKEKSQLAGEIIKNDITVRFSLFKSTFLVLILRVATFLFIYKKHLNRNNYVLN